MSDSIALSDDTLKGPGMAQVLIRDLPDEVVLRLKALARAHGRPLEAELREILQHAADLGGDQLREVADEIAAATADRVASDSVVLLRQDRQR